MSGEFERSLAGPVGRHERLNIQRDRIPIADGESLIDIVGWLRVRWDLRFEYDAKARSNREEGTRQRKGRAGFV
jgi:hypothetical protein